MKYILMLFLLFVFSSSASYSQSFKVKAKGIQTFDFEDAKGRNQISFFSTMPLEDITGTSNAVSGNISFDLQNFSKTLKGKLLIKVASMKTGIDLRDQHLKGANWLDEKKYPEISFEIKSVENVKQISDNKLEIKVKGSFTLHGISKDVTADAEAAYLDENEQTQKRTLGDLIGVRAKFKIKLSDYDIDNSIIGNKVADDIEISVNIVGSNK